MRFFELIDDVGISFYRWDDELDILYFWNEVDKTWEPSIWRTFSQLSEYCADMHPCHVTEVTEDDVR